jgi:predicted nuclease of restriction endonuclease-like (RecB) superfamily
MYWEIGNTISQQEISEGWGAKTVEKLANDLKSEFPDIKGFSARNLRYMRTFALEYPEFVILQQNVAKLQNYENQTVIILQRIVAKLPWGHNCTLLDKTKDPDERLFYAQKTLQNGWTKNMLSNQLETGLYKRQGSLTNNFSDILPAYDSELALQLFKDPYNLDFIMLGDEARERDLELALMNHVTKFLLELGDGFAFMARQKKFEAGGKEFFIDLLFYHTKMRRHIIIELKIGEFEPEYVSKMNLYLGLADDTLKSIHDEPSIGLILCKTKNRIVAEYSLRDTSKPIGIAEYKIAEMLPADLISELPSIKEIEKELDLEISELQRPVDTRLQAIKEKLKTVAAEEIQTAANHQILQDLFNNGIDPMCRQIISTMMNNFTGEFLTQAVNFMYDGKTVYSIDEVKVFWKEEANLKRTTRFTFNYRLNGFRKSGTNNFDEFLSLDFVTTDYWYGFILDHFNNGNPILKKMYHEPITRQDIQVIEDAMVTKVLDRIEWIINYLENEKKENKAS